MPRELEQLERRLERIPRPARITCVSPAPGDPGVRRIEVAGTVVATLDSEDAGRLGLAPGREWCDELAHAIRHAVARRAARREALRRLGRSGLSARELTDWLLGRNHDAAAVVDVVQALRNEGLLDEAALADSICRQVLRSGPAAPQLLDHRLRRRGIEEQTARRAVTAASEGADLVEEAVRLGRSRLRAAAAGSREAQVRRVAAALARRGFDEDTVRAALRRLDLDPDDVEPAP